MRVGLEDRTFYRDILKVKDVGDFGDECPLLYVPGGAPNLVVDQEKVTQRFVDEVEPDVTLNFSSGAVVLDESVQKHSGAKGIKQTCVDQIGCEISRRQSNPIMTPRDISCEVVVGLKAKT